MKKHISYVLATARSKTPDSLPKAITVRILARDSGNDTKFGILVGGQVAYAGDLAEVTESEAADLVLTGRAELLPN